MGNPLYLIGHDLYRAEPIESPSCRGCAFYDSISKCADFKHLANCGGTKQTVAKLVPVRPAVVPEGVRVITP